MKKLKHILWCAFVLILLLPHSCYADGNNLIYAEPVSTGAGSEVKIPVVIKNNQGVMGFRISVMYDPSKVSVLSVLSGDITSTGIFQHNAGENEGVFDILWSTTGDVLEDGTLFEIILKTDETFSKAGELLLDYSQEDTFNENFEDVILQCEGIQILFDEEKSGEQVEYDKYHSVVTEFVETILINVDEEKMIELVESTMKENGIDDLDSVDEATLKKVTSTMFAKLEEQGIETEVLVDDEAKMQAVQELHEMVKESAKKSEIKNIDVETLLEQNDSNKNGNILAIAGFVAVLLLAGVVALRKRKKVN